MRVYLTPETSRALEVQAPRERNITKMLLSFIEKNGKQGISSHPHMRISPTNEQNLFIITLFDVKYFVTFHQDDRGEYMIIVQIDRR